MAVDKRVWIESSLQTTSVLSPAHKAVRATAQPPHKKTFSLSETAVKGYESQLILLHYRNAVKDFSVAGQKCCFKE